MNHISTQLDYALFLNGFGFILLASICLFADKRKSHPHVTCFALLGLIDGLSEWLSMLALSLGAPPSFTAVSICAVAFSSISLIAGTYYTLVSSRVRPCSDTSKKPRRWFLLTIMAATYAATFCSVVTKWSMLPPTLLFIQLVQSTLVGLFAIGVWQVVDPKWERNTQRTHRIICTYIVVLVLAGGWFLTKHTGDSEYRRWMHNLQSTCTISAASMSSELVKGVDSIEDLHSPRYEQLKKRFMKMQQTSPEFRYIYLVVVRNGRIIFSADSEPVTSKDYSPPGDEYLDAPPQLHAICRGEIPTATAEYQDKWGKWFSAFIPVYDDARGKPVAILGMDYPQKLIYSAVSTRRLEMIAITLLLAVLVLLLFCFRERRELLIASISEARDRLEAKERYLSSTLHSIGDAVISTDFDGRITRMNRIAEMLTGWTAEDAVSRPVMEVLHIIDGSTRNLAFDPFACVLTTKQSCNIPDNTIIISKNGVERQIADSCSPILDNQGRTIGVVLVFRDVTEEYAQREHLLESEARLDHLAEHSRTIIWAVDPDGLFTYVSHVTEKVLGYRPEELIGRMHFYDLHAEAEREAFKRTGFSAFANKEPIRNWEHTMQTKDGCQVWVCTNGIPLLNNDGTLRGYHGSDIDITVRKLSEEQLSQAISETEALNRQLEEALLCSNEYAVSLACAQAEIQDTAVKLSHQATHDALTGLPNRSYFDEHLGEVIGGDAGQESDTITVLFLDLDKFKLVNDTLGHKVGDLLLIEVAERLQSCLRSDDILARMGGDEFTVILSGAQQKTDVESVASRMIDTVSRPYEIQGHRLVVGVSIGMASYPSDGTDSVSLLKNADSAMYKAKQSGRGNFYWYSGDVDVENQQRAEMEMDIRAGLEKGQFSVHYQPIVSLNGDSHTLAAEALLRWQHPKRGMISPSLFVPIAEDMGIIGPIGDYVLRSACAQTMAWHEEGIHLSQICVNVSTRQIGDAGWPSSVADALHDTGLDPCRLNLEVTETDLAADYESMRQGLAEIQRLGVSMSIDDFGMGQSSLSRLKDFPVLHLKIDGSFVRDIEHSKSDNALVRSIVDLAHAQGIKVTVEWVQTASQAEILRSIGCDFAQGYFFSPALSAEAFAVFAREWVYTREIEEAA